MYLLFIEGLHLRSRTTYSILRVSLLTSFLHFVVVLQFNLRQKQEGTSSELEENDSAIERSYSPTPERVTANDLLSNNNNNNNNKRIAPGFTGLSEASSTLAISKSSIYNFFSSRTNLFVKDDDGLF